MRLGNVMRHCCKCLATIRKYFHTIWKCLHTILKCLQTIWKFLHSVLKISPFRFENVSIQFKMSPNNLKISPFHFENVSIQFENVSIQLCILSLRIFVLIFSLVRHLLDLHPVCVEFLESLAQKVVKCGSAEVNLGYLMSSS